MQAGWALLTTLSLPQNQRVRFWRRLALENRNHVTDFTKLALIHVPAGDQGQYLDFRAVAKVDGYVIFASSSPIYGLTRIAITEASFDHVREKDLLAAGLYQFIKIMTFKQTNGFDAQVALVERLPDKWPLRE